MKIIEIDNPKQIKSERIKKQVLSVLEEGEKASDIKLCLNFLCDNPQSLFNEFQVIKNHIAFMLDYKRRSII